MSDFNLRRADWLEVEQGLGAGQNGCECDADGGTIEALNSITEQVAEVVEEVVAYVVPLLDCVHGVVAGVDQPITIGNAKAGAKQATLGRQKARGGEPLKDIASCSSDEAITRDENATLVWP